MSLSIHGFFIHHPSKAEITKLRILVLVKEYISRLNVPMEDSLLLFQSIHLCTDVGLSSIYWGLLFSSVTEIKCVNNLTEDLPNKFFVDTVLSLLTFFYELLQVSLRTILHYDVNFEIFLVDAPVVVPHNIWVM